MQRYEYKVVPAPLKGEKARGVKTGPDRFALALGTTMNTLAVEGWEYLRSETLPCDERVGLTGKATSFHAVLVFRRARPDVAAIAPTRAIAPPLRTAEASEPDDALPQADALDDAARKAGLAPLVPRPLFGVSPRLVGTGGPTGPAPSIGPAQKGD